jgi:hypothetical protein
METNRGEMVQDAGGRNAEPLERLTRQHAGAVRRLADHLVLFEQLDRGTSGGKASGRVESRGTAADDHDVSCVRHCADAGSSSKWDAGPPDYRSIREPWYQAIVRERPSRSSVVARKPKSAAARDVETALARCPFGFDRSHTTSAKFAELGNERRQVPDRDPKPAPMLTGSAPS